MKNNLIAGLILAAITLPATAQTVEAAVPEADPALTANIGLFSSYRFRGIDQTLGKPALQGGFDYSHGGVISVRRTF